MLKYAVVLAVVLASPAFAQQASGVFSTAYVNALMTQREDAQNALALLAAKFADLQSKFDALQKDDDALKAKVAPTSDPVTGK